MLKILKFRIGENDQDPGIPGLQSLVLSS